MEPKVIIGAFAAVMALGSVAVFVYYFFLDREQDNLSNLIQTGRGQGVASETRRRLRGDASGEELERLKLETKSQVKKKGKISLEEKFFQAGIYSPEEKSEFTRMRVLIPCLTTPAGLFVGSFLGADFAIIGAVVFLLVGLQAPYTLLDRRIKLRNQDILFYLPLVIEQIAIGVSSSLDIGPCIARVVSMADERDSHNVVTELLRHAQYHVRSGAALEDALSEIGIKSGHTELKHAFMSLSQVAKHGGEITRQLQELADAVANQRETQIEAKIKKLELEATGPVALVFLGFLVILLIGFGIQVKDAFG
ncbi:MAG: type II secretion system F family protein [Bdellovibrionales bacterium]|nr:type II secretion system F family protein [Bdellovibrionales bacterium]